MSLFSLCTGQEATAICSELSSKSCFCRANHISFIYSRGKLLAESVKGDMWLITCRLDHIHRPQVLCAQILNTSIFYLSPLFFMQIYYLSPELSKVWGLFEMSKWNLKKQRDSHLYSFHSQALLLSRKPRPACKSYERNDPNERNPEKPLLSLVKNRFFASICRFFWEEATYDAW